MRKTVLILLLLVFVSSVLSLPFINQSLSGAFEVKEYETPVNQTSNKIIQNGTLNLPTGLVILALSALAIFLYAFEVDPIWVVLIVFMAFLTGAVTYFKLPAYIIPVALVLSLIGGYLK